MMRTLGYVFMGLRVGGHGGLSFRHVFAKKSDNNSAVKPETCSLAEMVAVIS